jgi:class 3 adenylate cyclase/Flp pilus assembly protein TadD/predicted Ser/Thr protein kinase
VTGPQETNIDRLLLARAEIDEQLRQHKTPLTILFTDVVGSTSYFDRYGDTAGLAMIRRHADLAENIFKLFQGRIIKTIGDSVMAEFPEPALAARGAVELQRRQVQANHGLPERDRIQVRIGIHCGNGFRYGGDVYGDVVNVAARVTKNTGPAQILISADVHEAIAKDPELRSNWLGKITMAGKAEQGNVYELVWTGDTEYSKLRQDVNAALAQGKLGAPGLRLDELLEPVPQAPTQLLGATEVEPPNAAVSELPARYETLGEVGRGGMGIVYKARDSETGEVVAVKVLKPEIAADPAVMDRFKNELRLARKITHKNVCRLHEFNRVGDVCYITMEFVEGESLRARLNRKTPLDLNATLELVRQIAEGLQEAHRQGVVHRDLKPENVVVTPDGYAKVMDFGIARSLDPSAISQTMTMIGTPAYMAPEQAMGKPVDNRTDIYAFGIMLYEMVTGRPAFRADTAVAVLLQQVTGTPQSPRDILPSLPVYVSDTILRCLEKDPANRFASMEELLAALAKKEVGGQIAQQTGPAAQATQQSTVRIPQARPVQSPPPGQTPAGSSRRGIHPAVWVVLLALAAGGVFAAMRLGHKAQITPTPQAVASSQISAPAPVAASTESATSDPAVPNPPAAAAGKGQVQAPDLKTTAASATAATPAGLLAESSAPTPPDSVPPEQNGNPQAQQIRKWVLEGEAAIRAAQYDRAAAAFQQVLAVAPKNQNARAGMDYLDRMKRGTALPRLSLREVRSELDKADGLLNNGDYDGAINAFKAVIERNPDNPRAENGLFRARRAKAAARSNQPPR